jgi:RNA polymerase sigma-70 factor (ECF subfamily)
VSEVTSLDPGLVQRQYERARAGRWNLATDRLRDALLRSVRQRFGEAGGPPEEVRRYLESLHVEDLALACACADGLPEAWDHFVLAFRPVLYRTAEALRVPGDARELADSTYADLYGLEERDGVRRSLFNYFHGRSSLAGWLRSVLAQRAVDRARAAKRVVPLPDEPEAADRVTSAAAERQGRSSPDATDPERATLVSLVRSALLAAIQGLEARSRLRLSLYYTQGRRLAQIGTLLGESEATASRKLEKTRRELRASVESHLRSAHGLDAAQVALAVEYAMDDELLDLDRALPVPDS